jgi:uncharacterized protein (TIGR02246 family)
MTAEENAVRAVARSLEAAWNAMDAAAFAAPFADDADFIDVLGRHHRGRAVIEAGHRQIFDTFYKGSTQTYTIEGVRFPAADVAVVFVHAVLRSFLAGPVDDPRRDSAAAAATPREDHARPTLVLHRHPAGWRIIAFQNTRVAGS